MCGVEASRMAYKSICITFTFNDGKDFWGRFRIHSEIPTGLALGSFSSAWLGKGKGQKKGLVFV
jgi:hypothetical protein